MQKDRKNSGPSLYQQSDADRSRPLSLIRTNRPPKNVLMYLIRTFWKKKAMSPSAAILIPSCSNTSSSLDSSPWTISKLGPPQPKPIMAILYIFPSFLSCFFISSIVFSSIWICMISSFLLF